MRGRYIPIIPGEIFASHRMHDALRKGPAHARTVRESPPKRRQDFTRPFFHHLAPCCVRLRPSLEVKIWCARGYLPTRPLWRAADSKLYLHDPFAPTHTHAGISWGDGLPFPGFQPDTCISPTRFCTARAPLILHRFYVFFLPHTGARKKNAITAMACQKNSWSSCRPSISNCMHVCIQMLTLSRRGRAPIPSERNVIVAMKKKSMEILFEPMIDH